MSDTWINWRFGARHFQVGRWFSFVRLRVNPYHIDNQPEKWFEAY